MTLKLALIACVASSLIAGCGAGPAAETPEAAPAQGGEGPVAAGDESTREAPAPDLAHHMEQTFWMAVDVRNALIAGDIAGAERDAEALAAMDYSSLPADWKPWVAEMQKHAKDLTLTGGIDGAAQSMAGLARSCGNCHWYLKQGPDAERIIEPPVDYDAPEPLDERMLRHELAADELWRGMVLPSEESWRKGTLILTRSKMKPPLQDGEPVPPEIARRIEQVRGLAKEARAAASHDDRTRVYGEILASCADCHALAGVKYR